MKKITQSVTTGGAPIYIDDFKDVFNLELWDVIEALFAAYDSDTQGIIVSGCTISGSVGNYTISDGIVYLDGEFRRFASQSGLSLPQYIKAATDVNTSRTFEDTSSKTLYITKSADLDTSAPGTQYISVTSTTDPDDRRLTKPVYNKYNLTPSRTAIVNIGDWNMDTTDLLAVSHGLDGSKIKSITGRIRNDGNTGFYSLPLIASSYEIIISSWDATSVNLDRRTGGFFDSTSFGSTGYNRGELVIEYVD